MRLGNFIVYVIFHRFLNTLIWQLLNWVLDVLTTLPHAITWFLDSLVERTLGENKYNKLWFWTFRIRRRLIRNINYNHQPLKPPGSRLLAITNFLYSKKQQERVFIPIIADMRDEYFEAYDQKRFMKARWIWIRYCFVFIQSMGLNVIVSLVKKIKDVWTLGG